MDREMERDTDREMQRETDWKMERETRVYKRIARLSSSYHKKLVIIRTMKIVSINLPACTL